MEIPWRSSGLDSARPLQRAWVPSLVRELRSLMPHGAAKKKKQHGDEQFTIVQLKAVPY